MWKFVVLIVLWQVVFHFTLKDRLLNYSLLNMPKVKPTQPLVMKLLAELGDKGGLGMVVLLCKHFRTNKEAFTAMIAFALTSAFNTTEKMLRQEPRPYFLTGVAPLNCKDIEYGNPSGHAMVVTAVYLTISSYVRGVLPKMLVIFFCLIVSLNRFYMGVHSYDQLLHGFVLGSLCSGVYTSYGF